MAGVDISLPQAPRLGETKRTDAWWAQSLLTFLGLGAFIVYATWGAFQGNHYFYHGGGADYLSPFYSPVIWDTPGIHSGHAWFGEAPKWLVGLVPFGLFSPALLILWAPGGFRFTCYYYRGAYYKAFWGDPVSCAVGEPGFRGKKYRGEAKFPLVLQNVHRYFMYLAIAFLFVLAYDAWRGMWFTDPEGAKRFGIGVGTLVLIINPILLGGYTLGCHSLRHLVGGGLDRIAGRPIREKTYDCVSCLNRGHMRWAWASLFCVAFTDAYIRMCSMGIIHDVRLI